LDYSDLKNLELRLYALRGARLSDFGEKQNARRLEFLVRYYF